MKKHLLFLCIFLFPFMVNAKEYCKVVSGDGHSIGSEIACGTEHFYIINSNEEEIRMLAKYNLNIGHTIYKEKIEKEEGDTRTDYQYCSDLASAHNGTISNSSDYHEPGYCFYETKRNLITETGWHIIPETYDKDDAIEKCKAYSTDQGGIYSYVNSVPSGYDCYYYADPLLQSEEAIGAHVDENGNYLYPQVGDVYLPYRSGWYSNATLVQENSNFYDIDVGYSNDSSVSSNEYIIFDTNITYRYLGILRLLGYEVNGIKFLKLADYNHILNEISNQSLPLVEWRNKIDEDFAGATYNSKVEFGSLKTIIPEKYSWLYSTTYWNGAYFSSPTTYSSRYFIFTGSMGKICGGGFPNCAVKSYLGCGIRPVITIPNEVEYLIQTDTNENGEIEVIENALEGGEVSFSVKPNSGYKLASLVIKKANGEVVEITSDDLVENEDGTITTLNHFTMPNESVIIEARWVSTNELINPETRNVFFIIFCFIVVSCIAFGFHYNKKQRV